MKTIKLTFIIFALSFAYTQHTWSNTKEIALDSLFDSLEIAKIDSIVSLIPPDSVSKFEQKYDYWIESTNKPEFQAYSNPEMFKTKEYFEFKDYTLGLGPNYIGLLIDFFEGHSTGVSYYLLLDITYEDYGYLTEETKKELTSLNLDADTWHNYFPYFYFKKILATINKSDIVSSAIESDGKSLNPQVLNLYPNPICNYLVIEFELKKTETISIKLYNYLGQLKDIIRNKDIYFAGSNSIKWYKKDIKSGNYILSFESGGSVVCKKIVIK
jgi:hypothetical protein